MSAAAQHPNATGWERWIAVLPVTLTGWIALPFLRADRWVTSFDTVAYSGPNLVVSIDEIRHGRIPQWNPSIFGGVTHIGNPQSAAFEPLMWVFSFLPAPRALLTIIAVRLLVLSGGVWWLLRRRLHLARASAAVGAMVVVGSGAVMSRSIQFEQIAVVSWIPWVAVGADLAIDPKGSWRRLALMPVSLALLFSAGHPQQVYIAAPLIIAWCLGRLVDSRAGWHGLGRLAACGVVGVLVAAAALLPPALALGDAAISGGRPIADASNPAYSAQPARLPATVLGDIAAADHPGTAGSFEALGFIGIAAGTLAILGLLTIRRRPERWLMIAMAVTAAFGLVCALGPRTVVFRALYRLIPGFDLARVPGRWMLLAVVALSVLAAIGVDELRRGGVRRWQVLTCGALLGGLLAATKADVIYEPSGSAVLWWCAGGVVVLLLSWAVASRPRFGPVLAALAALAVAGELGVMSDASLARHLDQPRPFTELGDEMTRFLAAQPGLTLALTDDRLGEPGYLVPGLRPNANAAIGVSSLDGYDGGTQVTRRWVQAVAALATEPMDPELPLRSQLRLPISPTVSARLGVRWLLIETTGRPGLDVIAPGWRGPTRRAGTKVLLENPKWRAEARVVRRSVTAPVDEPLSSLRTAPLGTVVLERGRSPVTCSSPCEPTSAEVLRSRPGAIDLRLEPGPAGLLVVNEQLSRGWTATIDGEAAAIEEADGMHIGVRVPSNAKSVALRYTAPGLRVGLLGSAAGLAVVASLLLCGARRGLRPAPALGRWPGTPADRSADRHEPEHLVDRRQHPGPP